LLFPKEVSMTTIRVSALAAAVILAAVTAVAQSAPAAQAVSQPAAASRTLYERVGGAYAIATVVDDFIERLLVDDTLNANPAIREARARVPKAGLKFHVTTLVCQVTGGPCTYIGRDMKTAHAHLDIGPREWDAMVADFRKTLDTFKVPAAEQAELVRIVSSTRPEIVVDPAAKRN
jgi:hemoglobin